MFDVKGTGEGWFRYPGLEKHLRVVQMNHGFWEGIYVTPWKFNSLPLKIGLPNRKVIFQASFSRAYVKLRECIC